MFSMAKKFLGHVMPGVIRPIHILWNQVIGFFFIVLALLPIAFHHSRLGTGRYRPPPGLGNSLRPADGLVRYSLLPEGPQDLEVMT